MATGYTTVSGSNIADATGTVIAHATIYFRPVDNVGKPISFRVGSAGNGQILSEAVSATVTNGAFSIVLADTTLTEPINIAYAVSVTDELTGNSALAPGYLIQPSGSAWDFDAFLPAQPGMTVLNQGAAGPPLLPRGAWSAVTTYNQGMVVSVTDSEGTSSYISLVDGNLNNPPATSPSDWMVLATAGVPGTPGAAGGGLSITQAAPYVGSLLPLVRNLFDLNAITPSSFVFVADGTLGGVGDHFATGYIPCAGLSTIISNAADNGLDVSIGHAFYDVSKAFVSGAQASANSAITVPTGAAYFRAGYANSGVASTMVVAGSTLPGSYIAFGYYDPATADAKVATALATATAAISATATTTAALIQADTPTTKNLFDSSRVTSGWVETANGTIISVGTPNQRVSDYIPVLNLSHLIATPGNTGYDPSIGYAFYDQNKTYISGGQYTDSIAFAVPTGAWYLRTTVDTTIVGTVMIVGGSTLPGAYKSFSYDDAATTATKLTTALSTSRPTYGKNFGIFGDSLTQACGTFWIPPLLALTGMTNGFNDGHSGRGSANIFENYGTGDGTGVSSGTSANGSLTTGKTIAQDLATVDVLFVWLSTNDGGYVTGGTVGTPTDSPSRTGTFCACINWYLGILQAAKPKLRIIGVTSYNYMPNNGHAGTVTAAANLQLVDAMKATYRMNGCPCIDAFELSGLNAENWATYTSDNVHLNAAFASEKISPLFARAIEQFI